MVNLRKKVNNLRKMVKILRKMVENLRKMVHFYLFFNLRKIVINLSAIYFLRK